MYIYLYIYVLLLHVYHKAGPEEDPDIRSGGRLPPDGHGGADPQAATILVIAMNTAIITTAIATTIHDTNIISITVTIIHDIIIVMIMIVIIIIISIIIIIIIIIIIMPSVVFIWILGAPRQGFPHQKTWSTTNASSFIVMLFT